ncbi:MAG: SUF system NifU family Fe-S cluster assembly protein [Candidatus Marinimicrobia bacterium]|nr:SUF system NifU family Fe-S cluster assembly protein [Candidatus Neomarinimicrobiota bacterium]MDP6593089.1 SUF system NifU family Fe-S cluster assembly protein [Candidatus Neomarinimicrobiota bacterium]MDP6836396.1 SUF system NifU family Fe-S cluster assembly protein [Candidatus Neomarinimicrobiota bacterium]
MTDSIPSNDLRDLYQELILDHNQNPRNFREIEGANHKSEGFNPLCGDKMTAYINIDADVIEDISFLGTGCAISKASASIMTTILKGKTVAETKKIFKQFHLMVTTGDADTQDLGKLAVLAGVHKFPARVKCATLAWHTVKNSLDGMTEIATTE